MGEGVARAHSTNAQSIHRVKDHGVRGKGGSVPVPVEELGHCHFKGRPGGWSVGLVHGHGVHVMEVLQVCGCNVANASPGWVIGKGVVGVGGLGDVWVL